MSASVGGNMNRSGRHVFYLLVLACFFLSGAAGLIYEVVWARQLSLFLGITSFAHTAVITAYMAGLAAGSIFFWAQSRHKLPAVENLRVAGNRGWSLCPAHAMDV